MNEGSAEPIHVCVNGTIRLWCVNGTFYIEIGPTRYNKLALTRLEAIWLRNHLNAFLFSPA
jgi:hypothetical protein